MYFPGGGVKKPMKALVNEDRFREIETNKKAPIFV